MARRSLNPLREALLLAYLWRLLRRERDGPALAHAISRLNADPLLAARLGAAARAKALAQFDERIVLDAATAVYRELAGVR